MILIDIDPKLKLLLCIVVYLKYKKHFKREN